MTARLEVRIAPQIKQRWREEARRSGLSLTRWLMLQVQRAQERTDKRGAAPARGLDSRAA